MRRTLVILFVLMLPAVTPRLYASDEIQYFAFLRSLWFDRDLSFDNEYEHFEASAVAAASGFRETNLDPERRTMGRALNYGTIGAAILWSPFYAAGHVVARTLHAFGASVPVDGYSRPYVAAVCYGSAFYGFVALWIAQRLARHLIGTPALAPLAVWFGTPLLFYMYLAPVFAHACSAFAVALFTMAWIRIRERWSITGFATLGALAALMTMVREQDAFFLAGPVVDLLWTFGRNLRGLSSPSGLSARRLILGGAAAAITGAIFFLPQALAYLYLNGHLGPPRLVARKMTWTAPHALQVLFSPNYGLFFWTPLALLAIVGLLAFLAQNLRTPRFGYAQRAPSVSRGAEPHASTTLSVPRATVRQAHGRPEQHRGTTVEGQNQQRQILICLLVMFALQVYITGSVESWTVAGAFGQRRFVSLTTILVIGVAALWQVAAALPSVARRAVALAVVACVWWNLGLMMQFGTNTMNRQRLELAKNARQTFVELPLSAPSLVWRYFTDRPSFYKQPSP